MKLRLAVAAFGVSLALAACAPAAAPLALDQRVPGEDEVPGSEPDPLETQLTMSSLDEFEAEILANIPDVTDEELSAIEEAGFVQAIRDTRFYDEQGHEPGAVHVFTVVMEFDSPEGAQEMLDLAHEFNQRTCPETCAYTSAAFDVADPPNAVGAEQIATQESLDAVGDPGEPSAMYTVTFVDGPFLYDISLAGPPDEVSEEEAEEIAQALYERVKGAPPAESD
jgi:hypothetical protein